MSTVDVILPGSNRFVPRISRAGIHSILVANLGTARLAAKVARLTPC